MSTVEPTAEGTTQPKRNKETTRSTVCSGQLEKALGSTYVVHMLYRHPGFVFDVAYCHL